MLSKRRIFKNCALVLTITFLISMRSGFSCAEDVFLLQCMKIAESRDPKLRVTSEQVQLAESRTTRAVRAFFSQVYLQHTTSKGKTALSNGPGTALTNPGYVAESYGVKASQPLYEGYRTRGAYEYESMMVTTARYNYTKIREELFAKIKLAYYEYITLKNEYETLGKAYEIVSNLYLKVKKEYKAKAISELDLLEAENFKDKTTDMYDAARINYYCSIKKLVSVVALQI